MSDASDQAYLGEEFLTWLWFRIETEGGEFEIGRQTIGVVLDDFIAFAPQEGDDTEQSLRKGLPTRAVEARAGLRNGRRLRQGKLLIARGDEEWSVIVDGPSMSLRSLRIPADSNEATTATDRKVERIEHFLTAHELVYGLYELFLRDRLRADYLATSGAAQAQWMVGT